MKPLVHETIEEQGEPLVPAGEPIPGLVGIFSCKAPQFVPLSLARGPIELGRTTHGALLDDDRLSRLHVRVEHEIGRFVVTDLGSRNGTYVDGARMQGRATFDAPRVLRIGRTLLIFVADVRPYQQGTVTTRGDMIVGPRLADALARVARSATLGSMLLVTGESGSGKELAARHFHASSPRASGPFVAVNCATIPVGVAERLLFGARKGAYSGATNDAEGFAQAAHGGTLFLDEIAELESGVQPKLLRLLEVGEILPLGASRPVKVDIHVVGATLKNLRAEAAKGRFREDLYYRIGNPEVRLPPLRDRLEEMPWLIRATLQKSGATLEPHPQLVEACALRAWPGNVRELSHELRQAAENALAAGRTVVEAGDLDPSAGLVLVDDNESEPQNASKPNDERIAEVLRRECGNVSAAARALGMHRTQLRRWLARRGGYPQAVMPDEGGHVTIETE
ncbi:sigma 54-interacting transcriptional regulator [Polyangium mundeleinium]|uniref:Sigma 54-interacting transcriptional regulator n=1 Tax=Polyangium mundeleinium TaxID=2995306 RepID=A0ABT5EM18_9BACT|nr:sigma 54-interacting transcriptional regulator [Polyangium mundeleinium]MDC0742233.1 sigma 54-interacting transcriptional regulator [Polyangium mundeleinium]